MRGREFRPDMFIVVSNDPPDVYLRKVSSVLETTRQNTMNCCLKGFFLIFP